MSEQLRTNRAYNEFFTQLPTVGPIRFHQAKIPGFNLLSDIAIHDDQEGRNILLQTGGLAAPGEWSTVTAVGKSVVTIIQDDNPNHNDIWVEDHFLGDGLSLEAISRLPEIFSKSVHITLLGACPSAEPDRNERLELRRVKHLLLLNRQLNKLGIQYTLMPYWNPVRDSWLDAQIWASNDHFVEVRLSIRTCII